MGWLQYRHPELRFELPLPEGWEIVEGVSGADLLAVEPEHGGAFRANVAVLAERVDPSWSQDVWSDAILSRLRETLPGLYVLDVRQEASLGSTSRRVLVHHEADGAAVTLEQWMWREEALGYVLSATCATLDYDDLADVFEAIATRFRPGGALVP